MNRELDVAGRPYVEVRFAEGIARLTLVPAEESRLKTQTLRLESRAVDGDFGAPVDLPASVIGELFAAALQLVGGTSVQTALPDLSGAPRGLRSLEAEMNTCLPYLPRDLALQPSLSGRAVYWTHLGPHRLMRLIFPGLRVCSGGPDAPPALLRKVTLRREPEPIDPGEKGRLLHFTFYDPDSTAGDYYSFYAESLEVEFTGLT